MPVDTSAILNCSYGTAGFRLISYKYTSEPVLKSPNGRVGTKITIDGEGDFDVAASAGAAAAFVTRQALIAAQMSIDGQNFIITGLGGQVLFALLAAQCQQGGPFCKFEITGGDGPLHGKISFSLSSPVDPQKPGDPPKVTYSADTKTLPDGRTVITWTGQINGNGAADAFGPIADQFQSLYANPDWVVTLDQKSASDQGKAQVDFTLTAEELSNPLPAVAANQAWDGDTAMSTDIDDWNRRTLVWNFNYLITGDPIAFHNGVRQIAIAAAAANAGGFPTMALMHESVRISTIKGIRVQSSFTFLCGENVAYKLQYYKGSMRVQYDTDVYDQVDFIGAAPLAVKHNVGLGRLVQSGEAVCFGVFMAPPAPVSNYLTDLPEVDYEKLNESQFRTAWSYSMFATNPRTGNQITLNLPSLVGVGAASVTFTTTGK